MCRSACGLTRREKIPASAEGWRAWSAETRVVSNGRRMRALLTGICGTACITAKPKHAMVLGATSDDEMMRSFASFAGKKIITCCRNQIYTTSFQHTASATPRFASLRHRDASFRAWCFVAL